MEEALTIIKIDVHQNIDQLSVGSNSNNSQNLSPSSTITTQEVTQEEYPSSVEEESATVTVSTKPAFRFGDEKLSLRCYWLGCNYETIFLNAFTNHAEQHILAPALKMVPYGDSLQAALTCQWGNCQHQSRLSEDFRRHMFIHVFHCKIKSLGQNTIDRHDEPLVCHAKPEHGVPDMLLNFRCGWDTCKMEYVNCLSYYDHVRYHCLDNPTGKNVPGGIKCGWQHCSNKYPNITKLREHVKSHTQEKVNACPTCGVMFSTRNRLIEHFQRQTDDKTFTCDLCNRGFATEGILRDHRRFHEYKVSCPECSKKCTSPSALKVHMNYVHSNTARHKCPYPDCNYAAKAFSDLNRHLKAHQTETLKCSKDGCSYLAKTNKALETHNLKIHSKVQNPYLCPYCTSRYTRGSSLTVHLMKAHAGKLPDGNIKFKYKVQPNGTYTLHTMQCTIKIPNENNGNIIEEIVKLEAEDLKVVKGLEIIPLVN